MLFSSCRHPMDELNNMQSHSCCCSSTGAPLEPLHGSCMRPLKCRNAKLYVIPLCDCSFAVPAIYTILTKCVLQPQKCTFTAEELCFAHLFWSQHLQQHVCKMYAGCCSVTRGTGIQTDGRLYRSKPSSATRPTLCMTPPKP